MSELIPTKIYLTEKQKDFVKDNFINLSKFCRISIDQFKARKNE